MATALTNTQRNYLRQQAHALRPTVQVGRAGLTAAIIAKTAQELAAHELIKVKLMGQGDQTHALIDQLVAATDCALVSVVGGTAVLYREQDDATRREIVLPA